MPRSLKRFFSVPAIPIIVLLCVGFFFRFLSGLYHPTMTLTPDSAIYWDLADQLFTNPSIKIMFNPFKSPLYGTFLHVLLRVFGYSSAPLMGTQDFITFMQYVMVVQAGIGIMGSIFLYLTFLRLKFSRRLSLGIAVFHTANMLLIPWEHTLLTETLGIFLIILLLLSFLSILHTIRPAAGLLFVFLSILGLLLRPAFLTIPLVLLLFLVLYQRNIKTIVRCALITFVYLFFAAVLIKLNINNWNYRGLQITADINLLGKILQYDLPIESAKDQKYFYTIVTDYRIRGLDLHPYRLLDYYDPTIYIQSEKLHTLRIFTTTVLAGNFIPYTKSTLSDVPKVFGDLDPIIAISNETPLAKLVNVLQHIYLSFQKILFITVILVPFGLIRLIRFKIDRAEAAVTAMGLLGVSQVIFTSALVYEEYGRLISVVIPPLMIFFFYGLGFIAHAWFGRSWVR